ncbi:hypothetical protein [Psychroserpens ponticola]|uniref:Uncharacterized protein n=1 Tax=Psychroserpens ponticola TaxID=2932268 RepID=A0ABY7S127_9FLAO|nr:hypothetical protein [Psychroserpens ponticola]WCO03100.1 hypothetical protein MUN68_006305 [Psychroserpens ponticola]
MNFKFFKQHFNIKRTNKILAILLSLDLFLVLLHALLIFLVFIRIDFDWSILPFMVNNDDGYPEIFQYLKFIFIIGTLVYLIIKRKRTGYLSWLLLFILMLLDDALTFHERFGTWASEKFNISPMLGLKSQDIGELAYVAIFGGLLLILLVVGYYKGDEKYRKTNISLGVIFALFLFFGVGVDMLHSFFGNNRYSDLFLTLLEDGGEMMVLSLFVWHFIFIIIRPETQDTYLYEYFLKRKN